MHVLFVHRHFAVANPERIQGQQHQRDLFQLSATFPWRRNTRANRVTAGNQTLHGDFFFFENVTCTCTVLAQRSQESV